MQTVNFISQGRLTRDPELKTLESGVSLVKFAIAIDRYRGQGERETDFLDCVAWRGLADTIHTHFKKGDAILVYGQMKSRRYTNAEGVNVVRWDLDVSGFQFVLSPPKREAASSTAETVEEPSSPEGVYVVDEDPFA